MLKFGEWMPDIPPLENKGLTVAKNVLPGGNSYKPFPAGTAYSGTALDARPQGGYTVRDPSNSGQPAFYVGTVDKLYELRDATWTDISETVYATGADETWEFEQWGNKVVATNFSNDLQSITIGANDFAAVAGAPPRARHIAATGDFLMLANTWDATDGYQPQRVRWSGLNDIETWTVNATTQADYQDLRGDGGWVQKVVGGTPAYIFQDKAIHRATFVGSPVTFQFEEVESNRGAFAANSVIRVGDNVAYLAYDGFFIFNGQNSVPIGNNKIDDTFFNDPLNILSYDPNYLTRMSVQNYPEEMIIAWSYASINATAGLPDTILLYNYSPESLTRWSYVSLDHYMLMAPLSVAYTLDGLDAITTNLDILPFSLDSRVWTGTQELLGMIDGDLKLAMFDGAAMDARLETGEFQLNPNGRSMVNMVRPFVDGTGTVKVQIAQRNLLSESSSYQSTLVVNSAGFCNTRNNARYQRARMDISGGFNWVQGIDVITATPVGRR